MDRDEGKRQMDRNTPDPQAPDAQGRLREGRLLAGRFEVRGRIGTGRTGSVYAAYDRERGKDVAIKLFLPDLLRDDSIRRRLIRGAELARQLRHPGIVEVIDVGTDGDLLFVAMEHLEGTTLRERMDVLSAADQRFSMNEALRLGAVLSDALAFAHQHTVHGGISPRNVFLCQDGSVKLTDFGTDCLLDANQMMAVGAVTGTVAYMAPEQLEGSRRIDHRADQYATAAILYEMLTGQAPVGRTRSAEQRRPDTPRRLSRALDRALEPSPDDRFADMGAFAAGITGRSSSRVGGAGLWVVMATLLLLVAAGVTFPRWRDPARSLVRSILRDPKVQAAAETARAQAVASKESWRSLVGELPEDQWPDEIARAEKALIEADRWLDSMDYAEADRLYRQASELFEAQATAATQAFQAEPSRITDAAREFGERLDGLEREITGRAADAARRVDGCVRTLRNARTDEERQAGEERLRVAEAERKLMDQLKSVTYATVFDPARRAAIMLRLERAEQELEGGRHREALASYNAARVDLEDLLAWPGQVEAALRDRSALLEKVRQIRSALGPIALALGQVQSSFDAVDDLLAQAEQELTEGRVIESIALTQSAGERLADVKTEAASGLLLWARADAADGDLTAAMWALNELHAMDPKHAAGGRLRQEILSHRMTSSIGMELVFIPPGEFLMGSHPAEPGRDADEGQRLVDVHTGFFMSETEVTQSQWRKVMASAPSRWVGEDLPVEQVSWDQAVEFCRRLSEMEGRRYRLPTEVEWEYACRAGSGTPFTFGETISTDEANYDGDFAYRDAVKGVSRGRTVAVGSFPSNAWGLFDMHGNVWEWCADSYGGDSDSKDENGRDPREEIRRAVAQSAGAVQVEGRVVRGGSWRNRPRFCRCANRVSGPADSVLPNVGFRVVLEAK